MPIFFKDIPDDIYDNFYLSFNGSLHYLGDEPKNVILVKGKHGKFEDQFFVAKFVHKNRLAPNNSDKIFQHLVMLKTLNHIHVVEVYEIFQTQKYFIIIMERHGERRNSNIEYIDKHSPKGLIWHEEVMSALNYLHSKGINNRNITQDHIFLDSRDNIKIAEFGLTAFNSKPFYTPSEEILENVSRKIFGLHRVTVPAKERMKSSVASSVTASSVASSVTESRSEFSKFLPYKMQKKYSITLKLGSGGFGFVLKAVDRSLQSNVAIKVIDKTEFGDFPLNREGKILRQLQHKHIIKLFDVIEESDALFLVMEYAPQGDLSGYIEKEGMLATKEAKNISRQIVDGVEYLHSKNVAHRDLKPANILMWSPGFIKIADFGIAKNFPKGKSLETVGLGTELYAPPEFYGGANYDGTKFDVWSLGVIFFELLTSKLPFQNTLATVRVEYTFPVAINSKRLKNIIRRCLVYDPRARPTAQQIGVCVRTGSF